jgi:hypothetical protein
MYGTCLGPKQTVITKHSFPSVLQTKIPLTECYLQAVTLPILSAVFEELFKGKDVHVQWNCDLQIFLKTGFILAEMLLVNEPDCPLTRGFCKERPGGRVALARTALCAGD